MSDWRMKVVSVNHVFSSYILLIKSDHNFYYKLANKKYLTYLRTGKALKEINIHLPNEPIGTRPLLDEPANPYLSASQQNVRFLSGLRSFLHSTSIPSCARIIIGQTPDVNGRTICKPFLEQASIVRLRFYLHYVEHYLAYNPGLTYASSTSCACLKCAI